jgi:hypothetical protein
MPRLVYTQLVPEDLPVRSSILNCELIMRLEGLNNEQRNFGVVRFVSDDDQSTCWLFPWVRGLHVPE